MAFLSSLNEGKYGATTFLERWVEVCSHIDELILFCVTAPPQGTGTYGGGLEGWSGCSG